MIEKQEPSNSEIFEENQALEDKRFTVSKREKGKILTKICGIFKNCPEVEFAYVHGSFIEDLPFRDIDIAVYFNDNIPSQKQLDMSLMMSADLTHKLRLPVDVHALNQATPGFQYYATRGLAVASRNDEQRYEFVEKTWMAYMDYEPLLKQNLRDLLANY